MAITSLRVAPEVAEVGVEVSCVPVGTPAGTERRYYLSSAPAASALNTLETYADDGLDLADVRLKQNGSGHGLFTPDVAGTYVVAVRDITVYRHVPHFGGDEPATGEATQVDNELAALDPYAGGTAQASDVNKTFYAYLVLSRDIGFGQDTATLSLKVHGAVVADHEIIDDVATLTPGTTAPAKVATYATDVQAVLTLIRELNDPLRPEHDMYLCPHNLSLASLVTSFNEHIALDTFKAHTAADPGNALASTADVSGLAPSIKTRLDDIVAKFNAHIVVTAGSVHAAADVTNGMTAGLSCSTLAEAITYYEHCLSKLQAHAVETTTYHVTSPTQTIGDGYFGWLAEPPTTLQEVANAINGASTSRWAAYGLTQLYEQHRQRSTTKVHAASASLGADTSNGVAFLGDSQANLITTANALAAALNRHIQNLDVTNTAAATPYHFATAKRSRLVVGRAGDARSLAILIEELWLCLESHLWSAGPVSGYVDVTSGTTGQHPGRSWGGGSTRESPDARPCYLIRLQKAFDQALSPSVTTAPGGIGNLPTFLRLRAGFS